MWILEGMLIYTMESQSVAASLTPANMYFWGQPEE